MAATGISEKKKQKPDSYILGVYVTLCLVSIVESYSASSREIVMAGSIYMPMIKHVGLLIVGTVIMMIISRMNYIRLLVPSLLFTLFTVGSMVFAMVFGEVVNGAQRAIPFFGFSLQPAELAKIAIVLMLSFLLARFIDKKEGVVRNNGLILCVFVVTAFGGMLLLQGMTNTILFMCISFALLIIGGTKGKKLMNVIAVYLVVGVVFMGVKGLIEKSSLEDLDKEAVETADKSGSRLRDETWSGRIDRYLDRWFGPPAYTLPITADNEQEMYSYMAQGNGGWIGQMPGGSRETSRLPLAFSDYVFSIVVEDLGFVGGFFMIALYFSLLIRAGNIARKCVRAYPAFLVMGMALMVVLQAFFHMAITTGVFPVSGQPLPLISKGGTSILVTCMAFGVMLSVSRTATTKANVAKDIRQEKEALPEQMRAANPTGE